MYLIEILLPLQENDGAPQPSERFRATEQELIERFGGVTSHVRSPARGKWTSDGKTVERDEIVICEVMAGELDREWWKSYRQRLEERFVQRTIVVRAGVIEPL
jgi:hypothetical protein